MAQNTSSLIALDVALLFDPASIGPLYEANKAIHQAWPESFLFDENHLPHVTLLQAFIDKSLLDSLRHQITSLIEDFDLYSSPLSVTFTALSDATSFEAGVHVGGLTLHEDSGRLHALHSSLVDHFKSYHQPHGDHDAFYLKSASPQSVAWVTQYIEKKSKTNFDPHLTLGFGSPSALNSAKASLSLPMKVSPNRLVSAQLGDFCTVSSQIFHQWELPGDRQNFQ